MSDKLKLIKTASSSKKIRTQIESIKRQKIVSKKVVSLSDFRELKRTIEVKTILVVDDDEIMRNAIKRILEVGNYKVLLAEDGLELSKILEATRLDMILLDINLPWIDGYELCKLLKDHQTLRHIPVVLVSARKSKEDIEKGFEAGADDYITKPFEVDFMTKSIEKILNQS